MTSFVTGEETKEEHLKRIRNMESQPIEKKVLCHFCNKPIHLKHLGLIFGYGGNEIFVCDNICCLVEADEKFKLILSPIVSDKLKQK